jgi:hypothetical protein
MSSKITTTFLESKAGTSFVKIDVETAQRYVQGSIGWQDVKATELRLNPDSKNRYLVDALPAFEDVTGLGFDKRSIDEFGLPDEAVVELQKAIADSFSFGDEATRTVAFVRNPNDTLGFGDAHITTLTKSEAELISLSDSDEVQFAKTAAHSFGFTDSDASAFTKGLSDSFPLSDADSFGLDKPITHAFSLGDADSFTFSKNLSDAFTLDDISTVDAISKDVEAVKNNVFGLADERALGLEKAVSEFLEMTESVNVTLISLNSSVLNASALNTFTLN